MRASLQGLGLTLLLAALVLSGCGGGAAPADTAAPAATLAPAGQTSQPGMANPASTNCVNQGGQVVIETRGDGGQYGVCLFEDNRQCEEWALLRGDCPVGGVRVTGYTTPAAVFCAISGGGYAVTANSGEANEQGTCTFKNGKSCPADDFYNGTCTAE